MDVTQKYKQLRQTLIENILAINSLEKKPSKTALLKMSDSDLVNCLFETSVISEKEFWKDEICKEILKLNPKAKVKDLKNNASSLIFNLIKTVKDLNEL
jgi:hypothetical protein